MGNGDTYCVKSVVHHRKAECELTALCDWTGIGWGEVVKPVPFGRLDVGR